jgi:hypothetical protein
MLPVLTFNCSRVSSELTSPRRGSSSASGDDHGRSARCAPPDSSTRPAYVLPSRCARLIHACLVRLDARSLPNSGPPSLKLVTPPPWPRAAHTRSIEPFTIFLTQILWLSLSPFLNARSLAGVACGCLQSMPQAPPRAILYSQGLYSTLKGYSLSRATQSQGLLNLKGYSLSRGLLTLKGTIGCATAARSVVGRSTLSRATAARTTAAHSTSSRSTADCCTANRSTANRSTADHSLDDRSSLNRPSLAPSTFALATCSRARPPLLKGCDHSQGLPSQSSPLLRGAVGPSSMTHRLHVYIFTR